MKVKRITLMLGMGLIATGLSEFVYANQVTLVTNTPTTIVYHIAHQTLHGTPVFGQDVTVKVDGALDIPVDLNGYALAGVVPVSVNGHELPEQDNEFNHKDRCSMTTDQKTPTGALIFTTSKHETNCQTVGGKFV